VNPKFMADKPIAQFSGGMRRRLDLAASLITLPPLIFLDEPTTVWTRAPAGRCGQQPGDRFHVSH
jgi:ABC-type phosphonate transport system ATPase subunit